MPDNHMIKAVFFDLYHTVVRYEPPREELEAAALAESGVHMKPEALRRPLAVADEFIYKEISQTPLGRRSDEDRRALYTCYQEIVLKEAGIKATQQIVLSLLGRMQRAKTKLVLFDDVMPVLTDLKERGLVLGLISNVDRDIGPLLGGLGVGRLLQVVVTSQDAGSSKPQPRIFAEAARRAGVKAGEAMYVGDQYQIDVLGAENAGMKGVLLDRYGYFESKVAGANSPRIQSLTQVAGLL